MRPHLHACLWLGLAVSACDKTEAPSSPDEDRAAPRVTKTDREPREELPEPRRDYRAALEKTAEIPSAEARENAIAGIAWDALELDPELARDALGKLAADSPARIRLIQHLAMRMAEGDVDAALEWAATLGTETEGAAAFGHIALVLSDSDPARAANLLSESGVAGRGFDVVAVQVLGRWAARSPADAAAWVAVFPPGASREAGLGTVISTWAETDAPAVFSWMATLKDEAVRQETTKAISAALLGQPDHVRAEWLAHADEPVRMELKAQLDAAAVEAGNSARPPVE